MSWTPYVIMSQHCSSNEGFPLIRYLSTSIGKLIALFSFNNQSKHEMRKSVSSRNFWLRKLLNDILDNFDWEGRIFCPFTWQFTMKIFFDRWMKVCTGLVNTLGGWLISDPGLVEAQHTGLWHPLQQEHMNTNTRSRLQYFCYLS